MVNSRIRKRKVNLLTKPKRKQLEQDEILSSDDDLHSDVEENGAKKSIVSEDEEDFETAHEKRFRLAKQYLNDIEKQEKEKAESNEIDHDAIAHRLKEDILAKSGRLYRKIADKISSPCKNKIRIFRGHKLSPTCLAVSSDGKTCVSGSKDGSIIIWELSSGKKLKVANGFQRINNSTQANNKTKSRGHILCLALSFDQKFLCSGGSDSLIRVWNFNDLALIKEFSGHKGPVTGLSFRQGYHQLFSCGQDKSVKVWNLDEMGYVDTMFGHQDSISAIDSLSRERAITAGSRDRTIRIWKIVEESQLVFNAHSGCGSIECLSLINEDHFVSGSDDGSISVWSVMKKKPVCNVEQAHKIDTKSSGHEVACWISAVDAAKFTDVVASGSRDGNVRIWHCAENYKSLDLIFSIPLEGSINDVRFTPDCTKLICAVGQEHKLGRWWKMKEAKNAIYVIPLQTPDNV